MVIKLIKKARNDYNNFLRNPSKETVNKLYGEDIKEKILIENLWFNYVIPFIFGDILGIRKI